MLYIALLMVLATPGPASESPKPPWLWTADERIAQRVDPAARRARRVRDLPKVRKVATGWSPINGSEEPQLFFPWELMRSLVLSADAQAPYGLNRREHYRVTIQRAGWDYDEFWRTLESAAAPYIALMRQSAEAQRASRGRADLKELDALICAVQADMPVAAYNHFGANAFNEFLYTTVAPPLHMWIDDRAEAADTLRKTERGCK